MNCDEAITRLREHRQQLEAIGVRHAAIFWRQARSIGNVLRHDDDEIENPTIWFAIIQDLPKLPILRQLG